VTEEVGELLIDIVELEEGVSEELAVCVSIAEFVNILTAITVSIALNDA